MYLKVHEGQGKKIVAVCDKELVGRVLEEGDKFIDLDTYRSFYVGKLSTRKEVSDALEDFSSANFVGRKAVGVVLELGIAGEESVMYIKDIPYIQIYKF